METDNSKEKNDSNGTKKTPPKAMKSKAKLISPQLLACKIETNTVEMPPALRQRHIQLQALQASRSSAELFVPQPVTIQTVQNDLRHRGKKAVVVDDINQSSSNGASTSDDDSSSDENRHFESYLVIEFSPDIQKKTLHWIVDKIRTKTSKGGAGLLIRREPQTNPHRGLIVHVSAENCKFLQIADELELMKPTRSGVIKNFNISCLDHFFIDDNMAIDNVLTLADRQMLIKHAVDNIKATEIEKFIPGYENLLLYHGQSIINALAEEGLIVNMLTLRDTEYLKKLKPWYSKSFNWQPLNRVRDYFGESIGIYFAFVEYHTIALIVPAILGIFQWYLAGSYVPYFCAFYVIWMMLFLEIWKQKCSGLAYRWGTITMTNLDIPRIGYYGKIGRDPVTGRRQPMFPMWKTYARMYCVSLPLIIICMLPAAFFALTQFWLEDKVFAIVGPDSYWLYLPSIVESIIVILFSFLYEKLATWLTDLENHRTQAQYERHRVIKLILLEFVNNFLSLFYIAFYLQDVKLISNQLMTQLLVFQIAQKFTGTLLPLIMPKIYRLKDSFMGGLTLVARNEYDDLNIVHLSRDDERIKQNEAESTLLEYNSTYEDYLEMYIQFGYVVLFASISPFSAIAALINNIIEMRIDAYKLCCVFRRPFAKRVKNTGAWLLAFEAMIVMSIITNCGLLYLQPEIRDSPRPKEHIVMEFVVVEHILLAVAWALNKGIPDRPLWVRIALAKADYESRQAVKRENAQLTRKVLFRRFYSLRGRNKAD
ncbi:anoctamin-10 [Contarinia nasturtii]|uniref:anoctamin-10 n=1 Tax=Contarinia nasturtii TaxID=265458 RepID=UPI0012D3F1F3|nr:anoctamin-10 [Contarinia nasturtii]XP_031623269.1 anoctamin-10 [Contarinia nasturtii]XP_031623270.1 anoctamin-10 [Contarinia nasturtii]